MRPSSGAVSFHHWHRHRLSRTRTRNEAVDALRGSHSRWRHRRQHLNGASLYRGHHHDGKPRQRHGLARRSIWHWLRFWTSARRHSESLGHSRPISLCRNYVFCQRDTALFPTAGNNHFRPPGEKSSGRRPRFETAHQVIKTAAARVGSDDLLSLHRRLLDHDVFVRVLHDVSFRLRRATYRLPVRLRRRDRGGYSGRVDWAVGETFWRTAARDRRRVLFCDLSGGGALFVFAGRRAFGGGCLLRLVFGGKFTRESAITESRVKECRGRGAGDGFGRNAISG